MLLYFGIMSGTSLDGLDICLTTIDNDIQLLDSCYLEFPPALRQELLSLCQPADNELVRMSVAEQQWAQLAAQGIHTILKRQKLTPKQIRATGSHGQTIRHHPELGFSVQIGAPALLAELTDIPVVTHFRQRDLAAAGQGAPLVPAFHQWLFEKLGHPSAILNIGGFSNISFVTPGQPVTGFDCGPGNVLLDAWISRHKGTSYDKDGDWARSGRLCQSLLERLLQADYFKVQGPKSTGRELFNLAWLDQQLQSIQCSPVDVQATLTELTAVAIQQSILTTPHAPQLLAVCGGGARNLYLLERLALLLPTMQVTTTNQLGVPADWMEAMAFAWLAHCCLENIPANRPEVTGAHGPRVLGAIYPA